MHINCMTRRRGNKKVEKCVFEMLNYNVFKIKMNSRAAENDCELHSSSNVVKVHNLASLNSETNFFFPHDSLPATAAFKRARECVNLLQCWKSSYMETRAYIEDSGVGSRWEFDKKTPFGLVDHVTRISQDVAAIAKVRHQRWICFDPNGL